MKKEMVHAGLVWHSERFISSLAVSTTELNSLNVLKLIRWLVLFHKQTDIIKDKDHLLSSYFFVPHFITSYHYVCTSPMINLSRTASSR